jgi:atypical dual specificity phosphatase
MAHGQGVVVQCGAGLGRTGTMLGAWFIAGGLDAAEAIALIRQLRPGSIEVRSQEEALHAFAARPREITPRPTTGR